jgi:hypothetical protein
MGAFAMSDLQGFLFNKDLSRALEAVLATVDALHIVSPRAATATGAGGASAALPGMAGVFMALGSGYADAREEIRNETVASGFSQGFVCGLLNMSTWSVKSLFARSGAVYHNDWDPEADLLQTNAHNRGLVAGYTLARQASEDEKKAYLSELRQFTGPISAGSWTDRDKVDYVITYAAKLRQHFLQH